MGFIYILKYILYYFLDTNYIKVSKYVVLTYVLKLKLKRAYKND